MLFLCLIAITICIVAVLVFCRGRLVCVLENTSVVVFSLGKFSRVLEPGPHFLALHETVVDVRWTANRKCIVAGPAVPLSLIEVDLPPVPVTSSDGYEYMVDTRLKIRVSDIRKAVCCNQDVTSVIERDIINSIQVTASSIGHEQLRYSVEAFREAAVNCLAPTEQTMGVCLTSFKIESVYASEALRKTQRETMHRKMVTERKLNAAETERQLQQQAVELEHDKVKAALHRQDLLHQQGIKEKQEMAQMLLGCETERLDALITRVKELNDAGVNVSIINNIVAGETLRDLARAGVRHMYSLADVSKLGLAHVMNSIVQPCAVTGAEHPRASATSVTPSDTASPNLPVAPQ